MELLEGDEKALRRIEKALRRAGAADGETRPKVMQALDLTFEPDVTQPVRGGSAAATLAAELRRQYERLLARDPGTRLGTEREELHQFRVATRRLRAFPPCGSRPARADLGESLRAELGWLAVSWAEARPGRADRPPAGGGRRSGGDAAAGTALVALLERDRDELGQQLLDALSSDRYFAILDRLEQRPPLVEADVDARADPGEAASAPPQGRRGARPGPRGRGAARRPDQGEARRATRPS